MSDEPDFSPTLKNQNRTIAVCDLIVDAGPDLTLCYPGGEVVLDGSVTGEYVYVEWTPSAGLDDPFILNPTADISNTITYTLIAFGYDPDNPNLVENGDFEDGNTGFSSDYTYLMDIPIEYQELDEGEYSVLTDPFDIHGFWSHCDDHTTGDGNMSVFNGAPEFQNVWCQEIEVQPNTWYNVEAWVASVHPASPAILQFSINGSTIGPLVNAPGTVCEWTQFNSLWYSGSSTTAELCILNQNTTVLGNDFALDDISMRELCAVEDEVTITVGEPPEEPGINGGGPLCPGQTTIISTSENPDHQYDWHVPNDLDIVSGDGTHEIIVEGSGEGEAEICVEVTNECGTEESCITITLLPAYETFFEMVLCEGETIEINGTVYGDGVLSGVENFTSVEGCDSIVYVDITEGPVMEVMFIEYLCPGDSVFLEGEFQTEEGIYSDYYISELGCDSTVITEVIVSASDTTFLFSSTCNPSEAGVIITTFNSGNCDSVVVLNTMLAASDTIHLFTTSCNPVDTGSVIQSFINQAGCDSTVISYTTLLWSDTVYIQENSCDPLQVGTTSDTLTNTLGCDSIVVRSISYSASDTTILNFLTCFVTDTGSTSIIFTNSEGCDSLVIINREYAGSDTLFLFATTCSPNEAGTSIINLTNQSGCDSIISVHNTLLRSDTVYLTTVTCEPLDTGVFTRVYTNQSGCDSIVITTSVLELPENCFFNGSITVVQPPCFGDSAIIQIDLLTGLAPFDLTWQNGTSVGGQSYASTGSFSFSVEGSGEMVIYIHSANGLNLIDTVFIDEIEEMVIEAQVASDFSGFGVPCYGDTMGEALVFVIEGGTEPYSVEWSTGETTEGIANLAAGKYEVTITDDNGCKVMDSIIITEPPLLVYEMITQDITCINDSGAIQILNTSGGVEPWTIALDGNEWLNGVYQQSIQAGNHTLTITDQNGCMAEEQFVIGDFIPWKIQLGPDTSLPVGSSFTIVVDISGMPGSELKIEWSDEKCGNCLTRVVDVQGEITYHVTATDENGCISSDEITIRVADDQALYIPNVFSPSDDGVNDVFFISANPAVEVIEELSVYDRWGDHVFQQLHAQPNNPSLGWDGKMHGQLMNPGVFAYKVVILFKNGDREIRYGNVTLLR